MLRGDVDFINAVPIAYVPKLEQTPWLKVFASVSAYVYMLFPDLERDGPPGLTDEPVTTNPFKGIRVRKALSLATNRGGIVRCIMEGGPWREW